MRRVIIVVGQPYNEIIKLFLVLIQNDIKFFQRFHHLFQRACRAVYRYARRRMPAINLTDEKRSDPVGRSAF